MKPTNPLTAFVLLALAMIACNGTAVQTVEVTRVVPQTVVVTESVQQSGFTAGTPIDAATLPVLMEVSGGTDDVGGCFAEDPQPSIDWGSGQHPFGALCLNHFPTAPDSPEITVTLTDPAGHTFQESFTYKDSNDHRLVLNSRGEIAGDVNDKYISSDFFQLSPAAHINLFLPASLPCGDWQVSARTADGKVNISTTLPDKPRCWAPFVSVLSDPSANPFLSSGYSKQEGPAFANHETLYVAGTDYPANTAVTLAFYQLDPAAGKSETGHSFGTAKYAVSVMTDASGNFQVPFIVDSMTARGAYWAIAVPVITADIRLSPFDAQFSVK